MVWMPLLTNSTFCWWFSHPVRGLTWCFLVYHSPSPKELRPFEGLFDHHDPVKRPFFRASFFFFRGGNFGGGTPSTSHEISEVECNDLGGGLSPSILKNQKYSSIFFQTGKGAPPKIGIQGNIWEHHLDLDILNFAKVKVKEFRCPLNTSDDHRPTVTATFPSAKTKPIEAKGDGSEENAHCERQWFQASGKLHDQWPWKKGRKYEGFPEPSSKTRGTPRENKAAQVGPSRPY